MESKTVPEAASPIQGWFAKMFQASPLPIAITTADEGRFIDVNDSFLRTVGYDRENLIGRTSVELGFWGSAQKPRQWFDLADKVPDASGFLEKTITIRSGQLRHCQLAVDTFEHDGQQYLMAIVNDVTGRKEAERQVEDLARFPAENANPVFRVAADGTILYANQAAEPLLNYWGSAQGQTVPDDQARVVASTLTSGSSTRVEVQCERRLLVLTYTPIVDAGYVNAYATDITRRREIATDLRRSEARYAMVQRAANVGSWEWNLLTNELDWSKQIEPLFCITPGEFEGTYEAFIDLVHVDDRQTVMDAIDVAVRRDAPYRSEYRVVWPDGSIHWISATGEVQRDESGTPVRMVGIVQDATKRKRTEHALNERLKELDCLYRISRLAERHGSSIKPLLHGIANLLPPAWQYPAICRARLTLRDKRYGTGRICNAAARQTADIRVRGETVGQVTICYSEQMPDADEGPFLKEERQLIDAVAERVGKMVERIEMQRQLETEHAALEEANVALRATMSQFHDEKRLISETIAENVESVILPVLDELAEELPERQRHMIAMTKCHLEDITLPYAGRLRTTIDGLTPVETEICNLIRKGRDTKQIARLRNTSPATVNKHRERIRRKLHIQGTDVNLATHLRTLVSQR